MFVPDEETFGYNVGIRMVVFFAGSCYFHSSYVDKLTWRAASSPTDTSQTVMN